MQRSFTKQLLPPVTGIGLVTGLLLLLRMSHDGNYYYAQEYSPRNKSQTKNEEITLVTAFYRLPNFLKGTSGWTRKKNHYLHWMKAWSKIQNPAVVFSDDQNFLNMFMPVRGKRSRTKLILATRKSLWGFRRLPRIRRIYADPDYPKYSPNTVLPEYTALMHSKVDFLRRALSEDPFHTPYIAWLDIGYFRRVTDRTISFLLKLPPNFRRTALAANQALPCERLNYRRILRNSRGCIGAGFLLARKEVMRHFSDDYAKITETFLRLNLTNAEQSIIHAMYYGQEGERAANNHIQSGSPLNVTSVPLQLYNNASAKWNTYAAWFYLGNLCRVNY